MDSLNGLWSDAVGSKVIAGLITALIIFLVGSIWAAVKFKWRERLSRLWSIRLSMINAGVSPQPWAPGYPLKYYIEMRNDSSKCLAVGILRYIPNTITVKSFPPEVMQVRFNTKWYPLDTAVDKVAILPGQMCRAWIGIDEAKFNEGQVNAAVGRIGTLVVSANKKHFSFEL